MRIAGQKHMNPKKAARISRRYGSRCKKAIKYCISGETRSSSVEGVNVTPASSREAKLEMNIFRSYSKLLKSTEIRYGDGTSREKKAERKNRDPTTRLRPAEEGLLECSSKSSIRFSAPSRAWIEPLFEPLLCFSCFNINPGQSSSPIFHRAPRSLDRFVRIRDFSDSFVVRASSSSSSS